MDQTEEAQSSGLPHNPIVLAVPCSSAPGPCKCPEREKVARHRDRHQTAARRSPADTAVENPAAQLSHTSPSPTTPSPSHVQATPRHISCPLLPLSRVPHQSHPTTHRPSLTPGIATADRRPQTFAGNSRGVNKQVPTLPRQPPSSPHPPPPTRAPLLHVPPTFCHFQTRILPPACTDCLAAAERTCDLRLRRPPPLRESILFDPPPEPRNRSTVLGTREDCFGTPRNLSASLCFHAHPGML